MTTAVSVSSALIRSVRTFVDEHGRSRAVLQPLGESGVRVTLVGADGVLGDRVVPSMAVARALVDDSGWVTADSGWDRDLVSIATPRVGHWQKMAGWVAHQHRFPKARNAKIAE